jgi:enterochelin esterase-like enzyme
MSRVALGALVVVWVALGVGGAARYVHNYWLYRGFPAPVTPAGIPAGKILVRSFYSPALRRRAEYDVYLPPHYARDVARGRRYPVLFLLHPPPGLPDGMFKAGAIAERMDTMIHAHQVRPMILLNPIGHTNAYGNDTEWANTRAGRYDSFLVDLAHEVDRRFATTHDRQGRGLAGVSMGGYGAVNVALHHLRLFSVAQSYSGYFVQTPTGPFAGATPAQLRAASPRYEIGGVRRLIRRLGFRAWLFQGRHDDVPIAGMVGFADALHAAGGDVRYAVFAGGHDWKLWRREVPRMLRAASRWFTRPPARGSRAQLVRVVERSASRG